MKSRRKVMISMRQIIPVHLLDGFSDHFIYETPKPSPPPNRGVDPKIANQ
jgi:hypothetical protein